MPSPRSKRPHAFCNSCNSNCLPNQGKRRAALAVLDKKYGTQVLASSLKAAPPRLRERGVWCLGELGPCSIAAEILLECLAKEVNHKVRRLAYSACAKIGDSRFEEGILLNLEEEKEQVLQYALSALAKCGSAEAVGAIERVLARPQPDYIVRAANKAMRRCKRWW